MDKSGKYAERLQILQRQIRGDIVRLMRRSGAEDMFLSPRKSAGTVWAVFRMDYLSEYHTGYLHRVFYRNKTLSFEIICGDGDMIEISENTCPFFMDIPAVMIKIYKNLLNEINK
ncbi:MAG: hypothetical protein LBB84_07820 [Tannerellaceae bacterium]|jgi:hypothetical protein|nr:hypothetical protein [Tannerellaceae bacterium]